jgi:DNA-binding IclR family transcriptional regulator
MAVDRGSSILKRSWRVRVRRLEPLDAGTIEELERLLAQLERLDARGFNVYPSHYEPERRSAAQTVQHLRLIGATSGISLDGDPHLHVSVETPRYVSS